MSPPAVRIRIGGELESSLSRSLATANSMIGKAEKDSQRAKKATTSAAEQEARKQLRAQEQLTKASESLDRQRARSLYNQFRAQESGAERAAKAELRARQRAEEGARREIEKTVRAAMRGLEQEERARSRAQARSVDRFATRTSHRATRFLMPNAPIGPMVTRTLSSMARGAGVDLGLESNLGRVAAFESAMVGLRNQARTAGKPMRESGMAEIKGVADTLGYKRIDTAAAVGAFATKTGDVNLGLDSMSELAKRAAATNTSLEDMMDAAADVANGLGDIPDKSKKMLETIDGFIVQGARGAVEIKDLATKMPKFAASAGRFEGDTGTNMLKLGALGQLARQSGGATSAAEAATSVARFADTFGTNARAKQFKAHGINIFGENNKIRDPLQLIRESLTATKGNPLEMGKLFASSLGVRSVRGLSNAYNQAGGGDAGMKAVNDMFDGFTKNLKLTDDVMKKNLADRDSSMEVRAQKFNNKLEEVATKVSASMLPALERLEGPILATAEAFATLVKTATQHPWTAVSIAIGGAITASVARAGLESLFRAAIERALGGGPMPGGGGGRGAGPGGGRMAAVGTGLALGIPVATAILGSGIGGYEASDSRMNEEGAALKPALASDDPAVIAAAIAAQRKRVQDLNKGDWADSTPIIGSAWNFATNANETKAVERGTAQMNLERLEKHLADARRIQAEMLEVLKNGLPPSNGTGTPPGRVSN